MRSGRPEKRGGSDGRLRAELAESAPTGLRWMHNNPRADGGRLLRDRWVPDFRDDAVSFNHEAEGTRCWTATLSGK